MKIIAKLIVLGSTAFLATALMAGGVDFAGNVIKGNKPATLVIGARDDRNAADLFKFTSNKDHVYFYDIENLYDPPAENYPHYEWLEADKQLQLSVDAAKWQALAESGNTHNIERIVLLQHGYTDAPGIPSKKFTGGKVGLIFSEISPQEEA